MTEWWSYRVDSFLLFSARTYQRLIESYNAEVWPLQMVTLLIGVALLLWLGRRHSPTRDRVVFVLLALAWWWVAYGFLYRRFEPINWSAAYAALLFALQGALLLWFGLLGRGRVQRRKLSPTDPIAITLIVLGVVVYPFVGPMLGRPWGQAEVFALMPDPTVIATLGFLLLAEPPRRALLAVPLLWCLYSGAMLWALRAGQAWVPPALGVLALACLLWRRGMHRPAAG